MALEDKEAKERFDAALAREMSAAKCTTDAWTISKDREAWRARRESQARQEALIQETEGAPKAICTSDTRHPNHSTVDGGGSYPPHPSVESLPVSGDLAGTDAQSNPRSRKPDPPPVSTGSHYEDTKIALALRKPDPPPVSTGSHYEDAKIALALRKLDNPSLSSSSQLFNYENAEIALTLSEQRERVAWNAPFIPRSFEGQLPARYSDADHPTDKSDTSHLIVDGPNIKEPNSVIVLPDRSTSEIFYQGQQAHEGLTRANCVRNVQAQIKFTPNELSSWANARPRFFDVLWFHFLLLIAFVHSEQLILVFSLTSAVCSSYHHEATNTSARSTRTT